MNTPNSALPRCKNLCLLLSVSACPIFRFEFLGSLVLTIYHHFSGNFNHLPSLSGYPSIITVQAIFNHLSSLSRLFLTIYHHFSGFFLTISLSSLFRLFLTIHHHFSCCFQPSIITFQAIFNHLSSLFRLFLTIYHHFWCCLQPSIITFQAFFNHLSSLFRLFLTIYHHFLGWCPVQRDIYGRGRDFCFWAHHLSPHRDANRAILELTRLP